MAITRRFFIGGAAVFGAFGGLRLVGAPNFRRDGKPNLRFGVVSDIHIRYIDRDGKEAQGWGSNATFHRALEWFRAQNVDAVVIAGDMADYGLTDDLEAVVQAWQDVFPNDRYPDGRPVEKVFIYGNHDFLGYLYGNAVEKRFPDEKERVKHILRADLKGNWRKFFHEDYSRLYAKEIKGYRFVAQHWDDGTGMETRYGWGEGHLGEGLDAYFKAHGKAIDPSRPFFYVQHPHLKDTCYGSWAWGHDNGGATRALSAYPNAIALSGHSHYSLTDERSVWQGAFTSIGTSSLRYGGSAGQYEQRQGMLVKVYEDRVVIVRRDFLHDESLGDDWIIPLPAADAKPFAYDVRKAKGSAPEFAADAKLAVTREEKGWLVTIPCADAAATRAFRYEIATGLKDKDGKALTFRAYDAKYNMPRFMSGAPTKYLVKDEALPKGADGKALAPKIVVTPLGCFGNRGKALSA